MKTNNEKLFETTSSRQNGDINWMDDRSESDIRYVITMDTIDDENVTIIAGMTEQEDEPWSIDYYLTSNGQKLNSDDIAALQQWIEEDYR